MQDSKTQSITAYIKRFPKLTQILLEKMRKTIKSAIPRATEGISRGIPTFYVNGKYVVYFAGLKTTLALTPQPRLR